jgi:hypothetical protein
MIIFIGMLLTRFILPVFIGRSGSAMANAKLAKPVWNKIAVMDMQLQ